MLRREGMSEEGGLRAQIYLPIKIQNSAQ